MRGHNYTPDQALELLLRKLRAKDEALAAQIQTAIDAGKDVSESEPVTDRRKKPRRYRRTVAFSVDEALKVAVSALQAYFVEEPLFVDHAIEELTALPVGVPADRWTMVLDDSFQSKSIELERAGSEKEVEIELITETQLRKSGEEIMPLTRTPIAEIEEQRRNIARLSDLFDFS